MGVGEGLSADGGRAKPEQGMPPVRSFGTTPFGVGNVIGPEPGVTPGTA